MKTGYRDFCKKLNEKNKLDKDIKENKLDLFEDYRDRITFSVTAHVSNPNVTFLGMGHFGDDLFELDSEDLEYLYKKYSKKVVDEMGKNISEIKNSYILTEDQ